ncbi:hypothetical protein BKA64DRAFT_377686 [Cadophora sp. MPI-SDFR-AT-0126]|nr:hypothetical protein BKA64DRAFT_377686 [Leotiomycetes sp. MPI-SDFR-AT-0126]
MEPTNTFPITNNECPDQTIITQIDSDLEWDQFWREYNTLNSEFMNNFDVGGVGLLDQDINMGQGIEYQPAVETGRPPPSPVGQFNLPQYGSDMIFPSYMDPSPTPPWTDPSTSNSSPSATSYRTSNSTSGNSTPSSAPSSTTSEGSFNCPSCARTFAQKCLLNRHINTHTKPYKCPFRNCTERRATTRDLKRHVVVHDPVSAPAYLCTEKGCEYGVKGFKRKDNLKRHMENIHSRLVA